jgi:hypothetical protein
MPSRKAPTKTANVVANEFTTHCLYPKSYGDLTTGSMGALGDYRQLFRNISVFDYGAPVGLRLALAHPERITAIISQNGNAYEEGLSEGWNPIQKYWKEPNAENRGFA